MTYEEMKEKIYNLDLASLSHGIKVGEFENPRRFEAMGLGLIDISQIKNCDSKGTYEIYSGSWNSQSRKTIKEIVLSENCDVYEEYFRMIKDIEKKIENMNINNYNDYQKEHTVG